MAAYFINFFSEPTAKFFRSGKETTREVWALNAEKDKLIYSMMREWETRGFDVILSCPFPMPAISPKYCSKLLPGEYIDSSLNSYFPSIDTRSE